MTEAEGAPARIRLTRAGRRNLYFGRKSLGNTHPFERRAIWAACRQLGIPTRK